MFRPYHPAIDSSNHRPIGESRTPGTARSSHSAIESWSSATAAGVAVPEEKAVVDGLAPGRITPIRRASAVAAWATRCETSFTVRFDRNDRST